MPPNSRIDRYEIKNILGQGGMGIVYRAYDPNRKGFVALKTMKDAADRAALELFNQEWRTLANLSHPNIVDVLNSGEFEEDGQLKPYFAMPLLPGKTLDKLIKDAGHRLTVERVVEILVQTCRGLQAAHSNGLVHRDLKPSNLFVLSDDSVKIIDFGVVHLADAAKSATGIKGTLHYMAPEQLDMKEVTGATDIFALGVVGYEALTGRKPFERSTEREIMEAIRHEFPPPASDLNPAVSKPLAQVVGKAMAKNPWNRFASAREFADYLQQSMRGEPLEGFEPSRVQPRIERARRAISEGDFEYAQEILNELQLEGRLDSEITVLGQQVQGALRSRAIRLLLDSARIRMQEEEFPLAWQKIQEALERDPGNPEALALQAEIDTRRNDQKVENWRRLVHQHLHNHAFTQARRAIEEIRNIRPDDPSVDELLQLAGDRQRAYQKASEEKEQHFESAMRAYGNGEISTALNKLEKIFEIDNRTPGFAVPGRDEVYRETYNKIRSEWEAVKHAISETERAVASGELARAAELVSGHSAKFPNDLGLQALKLKVEDLLRQEKSAYIAETSRRVESEPDLNRRVQYLEEALSRYPKEAHFAELADSLRKRRDLVESIVGKARQHEEQNLPEEALSQWNTLRNIYPQYPGLDFERDRVERLCEQERRIEARLDLVNRIDHLLKDGEYERARQLTSEASADFPGDEEFQALGRLAEEGSKRNEEAVEMMARAESLAADHRYDEAVETLRRAATLAPGNVVVCNRFADILAARAKAVLSTGDWRTAGALVQEALQLVPEHNLAKSVRPSVLLAKRTEVINACVSKARELQAGGDLSGALAEVQECLGSYPSDGRLLQLQNTLRDQAHQRRERDLKELKQLRENAGQIRDRGSLTALLDRSVVLSRAYQEDPEFREIFADIEQNARAIPGETKAFETGCEPPHDIAPLPVGTAPSHGQRATMARILHSWCVAQFRRAPPLKLVGATVALGILALSVVFGAWKLNRSQLWAKAGSSRAVALTIAANIPDAVVWIDGKAAGAGSIQLIPGTYRVKAQKLGYKPAERTCVLAKDPVTETIHLEPEPQSVRISTDLRAARVLLDEQEVGALQDGNFSYDVPTFGPHILKLVDGRVETLTVYFESRPGTAASLTRPPSSRDLPIAVVTSLGTSAFIQANTPGMRVTLKSGRPQTIPAEGRTLQLESGDGEIVVDTGNRPITIPIETGNAPVLSIRAGVLNKGTLIVGANVAEADVYVDGRKLSRRLQNNKCSMAG